MHQYAPPLLALPLSFILAACDTSADSDPNTGSSSTTSVFTVPTSTLDNSGASTTFAPGPGDSTATAPTGSQGSTSQGSSQSSQGTTSAPSKYTKIHTIQGSGDKPTVTSAIVKAVVTSSMQGEGEIKGFFIQEEDADADNDQKTSEAMFVYCGACRQLVQPGDLVEIEGPVSDYYEMTQINISQAGSMKILASNQPLPAPVELGFPIPVTSSDLEGAKKEISSFLESKEGMRIKIAQPMTIGNIYQLPRYGEIELVANGRIRQFTDANTPTKEGFIAHQIDTAARTILWDDTSNLQNASILSKGGDKPIFHPAPEGFSVDNSVRAGNTVRDLVGVLHWSFSGQKGTDAWRIRPSVEVAPTIEETNPRPQAPEIKGRLKVAAFNVLNFFSTLDKGGAHCGPNKTMGCRGANTERELQRQGDKIAAALCAMDADIVGLMEIENNAKASLEALIAALDKKCPGYTYVKSGLLGSDAIKVGLIYKDKSVTLRGRSAALTDEAFTNPNKLSSPKNRPALLQTFRERRSGRSLAVVVNHLKSKGSSCGPTDDDQERGQGNCNQTRTLGAKYLANWVKKNTRSSNILILGDLNAYRFEDPIGALKEAGYEDMVAKKAPNAHSYVFAGQLGNLDYAMANKTLAGQIESAAVWNINADESQLLDYNDEIQDPGEKKFERKSDAKPLYRNDAFRSSDHDPVIVGISLRSFP